MKEKNNVFYVSNRPGVKFREISREKKEHSENHLHTIVKYEILFEWYHIRSFIYENNTVTITVPIKLS